MSSRIENLGDYNAVRIDLQNCNGSKEKLYNKIGEIAATRKAPIHMLIGAGCLACIEAIILAGNYGIKYYKRRKELLKSEPEVKKEFAKVVEQDRKEEVTENSDNYYSAEPGLLDA